MSKLILIANWKNHPESLAGANALLLGLSKKRALYKKVSLFVAPPFVYFESAAKRLKGFASLATQDIFVEQKGTFTGFVTPDILKGFGVKLAIIGHSERRGLGESDEIIARKIKVALTTGIVPVVCVGERVHDPDGDHFLFLREQIKHSLSGIRKREDARKIIIAYEPVWAIGKKSKDAISSADLSQMVIFIRKVLTDLFGRETAEEIPVIYGGSVEPANAGALYSGTGIRGFLVGHASLDHKKFSGIIEALN
jgi:triosephosphate isomerase (TIM)